MTITNGQNFANASTAYAAIFAEVFQGDSASANNFEKYCKVDSKTGTNYEFDFLSGFPLPRKWKGKKISKATRANKQRIANEKFEATTTVGAVEFEQAPDLVGSQIRSWVAGARNFVNSVVVNNALVDTAVVGPDGVAHYSTAHPLDSGSTQSNKTTSALSQVTYRAAAVAMMAFTDQSGRPLGVTPKKLIVGPKLAYTARDIIEAKYRTQGMTATGAVDQTASVVAAGAIDNVVSNDGVELVIEPLLTGDYDDYWFLIGEAGDAKPFVCNIARAPEPKDDTAEYHRNNSDFNFSIEATLGVGPGVWQCVYAGIVS